MGPVPCMEANVNKHTCVYVRDGKSERDKKRGKKEDLLTSLCFTAKHKLKMCEIVPKLGIEIRTWLIKTFQTYKEWGWLHLFTNDNDSFCPGYRI